MPEKTEAQKRAQKAYMEKFVRVEVRMSTERRAIIQAHAEAQGQSVNGYINAAIDEKMSREAAGSPTAVSSAGVVSVPSGDGTCVLEASEGRTEGVAEEQEE